MQKAQSEHHHDQVRSRNEPFAEKASTKIWKEIPSDDNPFIAAEALCHGYPLFELMQKRSFADVFYLLFRGEVPSKAEAKLLETLMIGLINPGPRHPATRAAMNAGIGKTNPAHILPIGAALLGGEHQGGGSIEDAMRFIRQQSTRTADLVAREYLSNKEPVPGFGHHYGGVDLLTQGIAEILLNMEAAGPCLKWGHTFASQLTRKGQGWLASGLAAAIFVDLGFQPRVACSLFQLISLPGVVAQGLEQAHKPITAMPFIKDEHYTIVRDKE